jgi:hypothetical protein
LVAEITQKRRIIDPQSGAEAKFFGGCTMIVGPQGEVRYVISKNIGNQQRLDDQLEFQRHSGFWETGGTRYKMRGYAHQLAHIKRSSPSDRS